MASKTELSVESRVERSVIYGWLLFGLIAFSTAMIIDAKKWDSALLIALCIGSVGALAVIAKRIKDRF